MRCPAPQGRGSQIEIPKLQAVLMPFLLVVG